MILRFIFIILAVVPNFIKIGVIQTYHRQFVRLIKNKIWHEFFVLIHIELNPHQPNNYLRVILTSNGNPIIGEFKLFIIPGITVRLLVLVIDERCVSLDEHIQLTLLDLLKKILLMLPRLLRLVNLLRRVEALVVFATPIILIKVE